MNRIENAVEMFRKRITEKKFTPEKIAEMTRKYDMGMEEYVLFQQVKSLAPTYGWLTLEEANTVYALMGNTPEHFNGQSLHVKLALTTVYAELLKRKNGL